MLILFYLCGIIFIVSEIKCILNPTKYIQMLHYDIKSNDDLPDRDFASFVTINFFYIIWTFIGMFFTSQSILFVGIIALGLLPKKKLPDWWFTIDAMISLCILVYIMLNAFVYKININDYVSNLISTLK